MNKKGEQFLQQYPQAAKVYTSGAKDRLFGTTCSVFAVNGAKPNVFMDNTQEGFFLLPGENIVDMSFKKDVNYVIFTQHKYTERADYTLFVEAEKSYSLRYDFKTKQMTFEECAPK